MQAIANTNSNNSSIFYILTDKSSKDSYLLKMSTNTYNTGKINLKWIINDLDDFIGLSTGFFHYKLIIDRKVNQIVSI